MATTRSQVILKNDEKEFLTKRTKELEMSHSLYFKYAMLIEAIVAGDENALDNLSSTFKYSQISNLQKKLGKFAKDYLKKSNK